MATTRREVIRKKALEMLDGRPTGIRYSELVRLLHDALPEIPINTIHGSVWNLDAALPAAVYKPARGVFKATRFRETELPPEEITSPPPTVEAGPTEEDFYEPFADWLTKELEECTKAIPFGGNRFKDKWGDSGCARNSWAEEKRHHKASNRNHLRGDQA